MASEVSERFRKVSATFAERIGEVPVDRWDAPAPCEGWVARDVVEHLVEWLPAFFAPRWDLELLATPSVAEDPLAAWQSLSDVLQRALDDPAVASAQRDSPMGPTTFESAMGMICVPDVLIHTWDLARATGLDEQLDADEVHRFVEGMEPMDEVIRGEHYGPRVPVPDDADEQTRMIAFVGRQP